MCEHADELRRLLADHDHYERRVAQAYRDGYLSGWDIGYGYAHDEMAKAWAALREKVRSLASTPTYAELRQMRRTPGGPIYEQTHRTNAKGAA
ncbi:hypothetical protein [Thermostaphylospora chromogena]|uniref:hypothetical protein n=1 Tax=Thermostaphylospora chromogena TaxID=35622 RepID=UPI001041D02E|nr:hypothetical protein [Thermostaphylospora chromogena]